MATLYDVAKLAGVSPKTVSRVLNESHLVAEETRKRVWEAIRKLDYHPNVMASSLKKKRSNNIGFVVPYGSDFVFHDLNMMEQLRGVHDAVTQEGYNLLVSVPLSKKDSHQEALRLLKKRSVDGVILYPSAGIDPIIAEFDAKSLRYVTLGMYSERQETNFVEINVFPGAYLATQFLLAQGHQVIGLITRPKSFFNYPKEDLYVQGYRKALKEAGVEFRPELVREGDFTFEGGYRECLLLKRTHPEMTALICASDPMTYGAIRALESLGLQVGKDVEVVAGDNLPLTQKLFPFLSAIVNPSYEQGFQAAKMLIAIIQDGQDTPGVFLDAGFVVRGYSREE
ncbi:LacI family DNA-binding transcriptional regulator [Candidatus Caldatribacterium sp. SIUC1]|uniref:LacI family DNA-binding transcriptional regulator n=1 Tax=Candidatus Caldatribacterium sp. SIUC1 TaxID=3418365 RepID=UPI003F693AD5